MKIKEFFKKFKIRFGKITIILLAVFAVLLALDLILKFCYEAFDWNFTVIPNFIWVENDPSNYNYGAAFSSFAGYAWGRAFLIILASVMFIVVAVCFIFLPERFVALKLALAMIGAGAIGNLIDRIALGYVRDFVWMWIFGSYACCNFADFWIVLGVVLAVVDVLFFNEWAVLPLTKGAKARVAAREKADKEKEQAKEQKAEEVRPQPDTDGEERKE